MKICLSLQKWLLVLAFCLFSPAMLQAQRNVFTPAVGIGGGINVDIGYKKSSASLRVQTTFGKPDDILNLSCGFGYRGWFDLYPPREFIYHPSFSDYLLYHDENGHDKYIRPMGGQLVIPVEAHLNLIPVGDDCFIFAGCGIEYGIRLYKSRRYERHYGASVLNSNSFAVYPMLGVNVNEENWGGSIALYYRMYTKDCFNSKQIPIKKFESSNVFGIQFTVWGVL